MTPRTRLFAGLLLVVAPVLEARAAVMPAAGYAVELVPAPDVVTGGVVRRGNAVIVGQGEFGPGLQTIVRLEAGRATTIATGFGGLGGFDLDDAGTLYAVDNCYPGDFGCDAATTGDTVYAIPDALTRTTPLDAADAELLPAGTIPFAFDVLATPLGLLVSDAGGPGLGRVVRVEDTGVVDVVTGLDYAAGLAFDDPTLWVGNSTPAFTGELLEFTSGSPQGALVDGLSGMFGVAAEEDGDVLVTGAFADDGSGTLLAVDAAGELEERARGFMYSGDVVWDAERDAAYVLDFGARAVTVVCADPDADGVCDGDCADGVPLERASLALKRGRSAGADSLALKGRLRIAGGLAADPPSDGLRLQITDAAGVVVLDVALPPGAGWTEKPRGRGWRFRDAGGALAVTGANLTVDRRDDEVVAIAVRSRKRGSLPLDGAALPLRATVVLDAAGECGATAFGDCRPRGTRAVRCR